MGDDAFRTFLRAYVVRFAAQPVRTADLLAFTRQVLGPVPETVLRIWVEASALPALPALSRPPPLAPALP